MRFADQHLSADDMELLVDEGEHPPGMEQRLQQARDHAASCVICKQRVDVYRSAGANMGNLRSAGQTDRTAECPGVSTLLQLAGGTLPTRIAWNGALFMKRKKTVRKIAGMKKNR